MIGRGNTMRRTGFTLIELLVVMGILGILLFILLPALRSVRAASRTLVCSTNMKAVSLDFQFFVEEGRAAARSGDRPLWINDFQERMYGLDEHWDLQQADVGVLESAKNPMLCPAGATTLRKRRNLPCGRQALGPVEDISVAVNMRLYRSVVAIKGKRLLASPLVTKIPSRILEHPYVPLVLDVDGRQAVDKGVDPFYIAPPLDGVDDPYASSRYWSPSTERHRGQTVVGFVGGHVLTSPNPAAEQWDWSYGGEVRR